MRRPWKHVNSCLTQELMLIGRMKSAKFCCTTSFIASSVTKFQFITPMETMIDNALVSSAMEQTLSHGQHLSQFQHIAQLFGKSTFDLLNDFVENRNFTTLHEVLLGITSDRGTLDEYLASFGQATLPAEFIDSHDACGRTALAWAAENGWADAVKTLLKYGSNPHQLRPSVRGKSPLLHLVIAGPSSQRSDAGFLDVVRQLLKAGVDVNVLDHEGWTPSQVVVLWDASDIIKELATSAASELHWNSLANDKQSATELSLGAGFNARVLNLLQNDASCVDHMLETEGAIGDNRSDNSSGVSDTTSSIEDEMDGPEEQFVEAVEIYWACVLCRMAHIRLAFVEPKCFL